MDIFTHSVFGALLYILFLREFTFEYFHIAIFFSVLPDLDIFLFPVKRIIKSNYLEHRGGSHSYVIGIIISAILSILFSSLRSRSFLIAWIIASTFYGLHVSLDLLTTTKIPYFFPLSKKEHCFYVEKAGSLFTMLNSIGFLVLLSILYITTADFIFFRLFINLYTSFFIIYYLYRIVSKMWVSTYLDKTQKYLPGVLPFYYVIYDYKINENEVLLEIERRSHFSKNEKIQYVKTLLSDEEMVLFKKGIELCRSDYYFAKWTLFPTFSREEGIFSIKFYFLETMMRKRTMYIQYNFNIPTQEVISLNQGSGRI